MRFPVKPPCARAPSPGQPSPCGPPLRSPLRRRPLPPALLAFQDLIDRRVPSRAGKAFLGRALYHLCRGVVPNTVADENVFEHSRSVLALCAVQAPVASFPALAFCRTSLICPLSNGARLVNPVYARRSGGCDYGNGGGGSVGGDGGGKIATFMPDKDHKVPPLVPCERAAALAAGFDVEPAPHMARLVLSSKRSETLQLTVAPGVPSADTRPALTWAAAIRALVQFKPLQLVGALSLRQAVPPVLTQNKAGMMCTLLSRGKGQLTLNLQSPLGKNVESVGSQELAAALATQPRDAANEIVQRTPVEALVICLGKRTLRIFCLENMHRLFAFVFQMYPRA